MDKSRRKLLKWIALGAAIAAGGGVLKVLRSSREPGKPEAVFSGFEPPTSTFTPTPTEKPPAPTESPYTIRGAGVSQRTLEMGGVDLQLREMSVGELAALVAPEKRGWLIVTGDNEDKVGWFWGTTPEGESVMVLSQGPRGYRWNPEAMVWEREGGSHIVIPDVILPGGWDTKTGRAAPIARPELAFMIKDRAGEYRTVVVYSSQALQEMVRGGLDLSQQGIEVLPDGRGMWVGETKEANLNPRQSIIRDPETGTLQIIDDYGSVVREMKVRWSQAETPEEAGEIGVWVRPEPEITIEIAPEIEGLTRVVENGRVVYRVKADNPYGLENGVYAGEFVPDVEIEGEGRKGGLVLISPVVLRELNQQLAQIPNPGERWLIPLPVDVRGASGVSLTFEDSFKGVGWPVARIAYEGTSPVVNVVPEATELRVGVTFWKEWWLYYDTWRLIDPRIERIIPGSEMRYIVVLIKLRGFSQNQTISSRFGDEVGKVKGPVFVALDAAEEGRPVTPDKILRIRGFPVFVAVNSP